MQFRITSGRDIKTPGAPGMRALVREPALHIDASGPIKSWTAADGTRSFVFGDVTGIRRADGTLADPALLGVQAEQFTSDKQLDALEGHFVFVRVRNDGTCEIAMDRFAKADVYYENGGAFTVLASSLDLMPAANGTSAPDVISFAHTLTSYGARPAKRQTLYEKVKRLGVGDSARLQDGRIDVIQRKFQPLETAAYGARELDEYADTLLEAVRARGSSSGNVVYLSSGWDSTGILACLVHLFGARKVRAVIGRMRYSERRDVINQFELDRAKAVAEFYGVELGVCELDYRTAGPEIFDAAQPLFRSQQIASMTGLNHWLLAQHVARTTSGEETVFAGEISDGAHNLGFSQFVTIFHPSLEFREYSDKMASYLFGPTFLSQVLAHRQDDDVVWQLFRQRAGANAVLEEPARDRQQLVRQFLSSFFLRRSRLPFLSLENAKILTAGGRQDYSAQMEAAYLQEASQELTPETLYAWYLHLYNSFHWQGSTVVTLAHTAAAHGLRIALPFYDGRLQDFLSAMPESWGRGLDLKPTKYPLKWMLENRVRFPMHLQVGPHSYLYDVDPTFSHSAELLFGSSLADVFKKNLRTTAYQQWLPTSHFDHAYIDSFVTRYLAGEEFRGGEMTDLLTLSMVASVGCYCS